MKKRTMKKAQSVSFRTDLFQYIHVFLFSVVLLAVSYWYISWLKIPNPLNKSFADTSIYLIGLSMVLASVCYFWNVFDRFIVYRKHLGIVGFAFGLMHVYLSFGALQKLFIVQTWQKGAMWPALTGAMALVIFVVMAFVTPSVVAEKLGGKIWRSILQLGHLGVVLIWLHVYFLKFGYILKWYNEGMKTLPSSSLIVLMFMTVVIGLRTALWIVLKKKS
ncbi:MAG: hypothetical protein HZA34_04320 [Candidatus Pacebacteria bacterium]|nr:hypothetical protein [Candidatus Paceibacterota bacterium]